VNLASNEEDTALYIAASQGHVEICQLLLDPGAWLII
jgi:ankyrin repeat protein